MIFRGRIRWGNAVPQGRQRYVITLHCHQFPQTPCLPEIGNRVIYRAWQEEGEGQFPIAKTKDWVEEDFGSLSERMAWATKWGFKGSAFVALCDIFLVKQITERKAQLARC